MKDHNKLIRFLKKMEEEGKWAYLDGELYSPKELLDNGMSWPRVCGLAQISVVKVVEEAIRAEEEAKLKVKSISGRLVGWIDGPGVSE